MPTSEPAIYQIKVALQNLNLSFAGFARRTRERLDETVTATQGAMQAAHARRKAGDGGIEAEASRMADRMAALETVKVDLAVLQPGLSPANEPKAPDCMQSNGCRLNCSASKPVRTK